MNPFIRNIIVIVVLGLLFTEFGYQIYQSNKKAEAESPLDKNRMIKEGRTVSLEEEEQLAINSFPSLEGTEYVENMLQAFGQCLISAPNVGESSFVCISNNVENGALEGLTTMHSDVDRGKFILDQLTDGLLITNISAQPAKDNDNEIFKYYLKLSLNFDAQIIDYELLIKDKKILSISKKS